MELWQMVVADHGNIEELCREVLRATGTGPNSRAELFADLQDELERHIAAQQSVIYPALSGHERMASYVADLERKQDEILRELDRLAARPDKDSHDWAADFKDLTGSIRHAFTLEENGVMIVARSAFSPAELKHLWRRYERERIASYEADRWHLPQSAMPSRYGLPTGTVFGALAGLAAIGAGALLWNATRSRRPGPRHRRPPPPSSWHPESRFPLYGEPDDDFERRASSHARTYRTTGKGEARPRPAPGQPARRTSRDPNRATMRCSMVPARPRRRPAAALRTTTGSPRPIRRARHRAFRRHCSPAERCHLAALPRPPSAALKRPAQVPARRSRTVSRPSPTDDSCFWRRTRRRRPPGSPGWRSTRGPRCQSCQQLARPRRADRPEPALSMRRKAAEQDGRQCCASQPPSHAR